MWRTLHPTTNVVMTLGPGMRGPFWWCVAAFMLLYVLVLAARARLEENRARLEGLYLALEGRGGWVTAFGLRAWAFLGRHRFGS